PPRSTTVLSAGPSAGPRGGNRRAFGADVGTEAGDATGTKGGAFIPAYLAPAPSASRRRRRTKVSRFTRRILLASRRPLTTRAFMGLVFGVLRGAQGIEGDELSRERCSTQTVR